MWLIDDPEMFWFATGIFAASCFLPWLASRETELRVRKFYFIVDGWSTIVSSVMVAASFENFWGGLAVVLLAHVFLGVVYSAVRPREHSWGDLLKDESQADG